MPPKIDIVRVGVEVEAAVWRHISLSRDLAPYNLFGDDKTKEETAKVLQEITEDECRIKPLLFESKNTPVHLTYSNGLTLIKTAIQYSDYRYEHWEHFIFRDCLYAINGRCTIRELQLSVYKEAEKERKHFERLAKQHASLTESEQESNRVKIPTNVRMAVWQRDQGKCAQCGSKENLEYDHIIPLSKGGGNTIRNIELLCESCNRTKSNRIE